MRKILCIEDNYQDFRCYCSFYFFFCLRKESELIMSTMTALAQELGFTVNPVTAVESTPHEPGVYVLSFGEVHFINATDDVQKGLVARMGKVEKKIGVFSTVKDKLSGLAYIPAESLDSASELVAKLISNHPNHMVRV